MLDRGLFGGDAAETLPVAGEALLGGVFEADVAFDGELTLDFAPFSGKSFPPRQNPDTEGPDRHRSLPQAVAQHTLLAIERSSCQRCIPQQQRSSHFLVPSVPHVSEKDC